MKKMIGLLVLLFSLYFGLQILLVIFGKGHDINYEFKVDEYEILINEKYSSNGKDEDNYLLTIDVEDVQFNYLTYADFRKSSEIVKDVRYFKDGSLSCIFLKFRNDKILADLLCHDGNIVIPYHNIDNPSLNLQQYVSELSEIGYVAKDWMDDKDNVEAHISLVLYSDNRVSNHHVSIAENKMLYRLDVDGSIMHKTIFSQTEDVIHGFVNNKYVAYLSDYSKSEYEVHSLTSSSKKVIKAKQNLGNQVVLGSYGESLYIYDSTNSTQYELDIDSEKILQVASAGSKIKYYESGKWKYSDILEYNVSKSDFGTEYEIRYNVGNYIKVVKHGFDDGYYYGFIPSNNGIKVFRSTSEDMSNPTYLFSTDNINSLKYVGDYIYYMDSNIIKYYSDITGNRTLLYFDGLNENSIYNVFVVEEK